MACLLALPPAPARAALVWHSPLDGDATASVGGVNGVPTGSPTATADRNGMAGGAVLFGGSDNFIINKASLPQSFTQGTLSTWVRNDAFDDTAERGFIAVGASGGGSDNYFTIMRNTQANMNADSYRTDLDRGGAGVEGRVDATGGGISTGNWHHVAATFDVNSNLKLWIDGIQVNTDTLAGGTTPLTPSNNWVVGAERAADRFWVGAMDDAAVWDSVLPNTAIAGLAAGNVTPQTAPLTSDQFDPATILVVTNNNGTSQPLVDFLQGRGHPILRGNFAGGAPTEQFLEENDVGLILFARESNSGDYDDGTEPQDWNALSVPMISAAPHTWRDTHFGWIDGTGVPGLGTETDYDPFLDPDHPWLDGLTVNLFDTPTTVTGTGGPLPPGTLILAELGNGASPGIFVIPEGTDLFNMRGTTGALRVGFLYGNEGSFANVSANGRTILGRIIDDLTAPVIPEPATAALLGLGALGLIGRRRRA
jgi:hypothetical protein